MARKTLSSSVMEECYRAQRLVASIQDSVDPIIAALLDEVQFSLNRIDTLCLGAQQLVANAITSDRPAPQDVVADPAPTRRRSGAHKASTGPRKPKEA